MIPHHGHHSDYDLLRGGLHAAADQLLDDRSATSISGDASHTASTAHFWVLSNRAPRVEVLCARETGIRLGGRYNVV